VAHQLLHTRPALFRNPREVVAISTTQICADPLRSPPCATNKAHVARVQLETWQDAGATAGHRIGIRGSREHLRLCVEHAMYCYACRRYGDINKHERGLSPQTCSSLQPTVVLHASDVSEAAGVVSRCAPLFSSLYVFLASLPGGNCKGNCGRHTPGPDQAVDLWASQHKSCVESGDLFFLRSGGSR
jgi:hypothetical protein